MDEHSTNNSIASMNSINEVPMTMSTQPCHTALYILNCTFNKHLSSNKTNLNDFKIKQKIDVAGGNQNTMILRF